MNMLNQIIIEGNVASDAEMKQTVDGIYVTTVPVVHRRCSKNLKGENVEEEYFFDIEAYGESFATRMISYATAGKRIRVVGRLMQERWKSDCGDHSRVYIMAEHVDFMPVPVNLKKTQEEK